jgi:hypothetical protein
MDLKWPEYRDPHRSIVPVEHGTRALVPLLAVIPALRRPRP